MANKNRPSAALICEVLGQKNEKPLTTQSIRSMTKALPGYAAQLDDAAVGLADGDEQGDGRILGLKDVSSARLIELKQKRADLLAAEVALYDAYRSIYHQRLKVDDEGMRALFKIVRRVSALAEDHPELAQRWKGLADFIGKFRPGPKQTETPTQAPEAEPGPPPVE